MCISALIHDIIEIPTAILMFSGEGNTTRLLRRLPDVWIGCELKMAFVNRKLICAIFDFLQIHTLGNLSSSPVLLTDPENMGIAVGTSLLWCRQGKPSYALCHFYFRFQAAIIDFSHIYTSCSLHSSLMV